MRTAWVLVAALTLALDARATARGTYTSDRNQRENFRPVDADEVLAKLRRLSVTSWNYKGQDAKQFHHYGALDADTIPPLAGLDRAVGLIFAAQHFQPTTCQQSPCRGDAEDPVVSVRAEWQDAQTVKQRSKRCQEVERSGIEAMQAPAAAGINQACGAADREGKSPDGCVNDIAGIAGTDDQHPWPYP